MIKLIRLCTLALSFYGYINWVSGYIKPEFSIGTVFSVISCLVFLAGILNMMTEMTFLLWLLGLALLMRAAWKRNLSKGISKGSVAFAAIGAMVFFVVYLMKFEHYDCFSHWGIAVKTIIQNNRFPNFSDINITFQSYPLGSAAFVYYVMHIAGMEAEWMQMLAQALLTIGFAVSIYAFANDIKESVCCTIAVLSLLCGNNRFTDLLVDTLLPIAALSGLSYCLYYQDEMKEKWQGVLPTLVFLITVKNSGVYFAIILLFGIWISKCLRNQRTAMISLAFAPLAVLFLWQKHVMLVYENGLEARHSLSIKNFVAVLSGKTPADMIPVIDAFRSRVLSLTNPVVLLIIAVSLLWFWAWKTNNQTAKKYSLILIGSYILYEILMLAMYLVSMPQHEAAYLAGYSRYERTILIFESGAAFLVFMFLAKRTKHSRKSLIAGMCTIIVMMVLMIKPSYSYLRRREVTGTKRQVFDNLIYEYGIPEEKRLLVLVDPEKTTDKSYIRYMAKYLLDPKTVKVSTVEDIGDLNIRKKYDYLIALDQSEEIESYMKKEYRNEERVIALR